MERGENVEGGCVREQSVPVELQEHFDVLSADMRMENDNKIKLQQCSGCGDQIPL